MGRYARVDILIAQQRYEMALELLQDLLAEWPEDAIAHSTRAYCLRKLNRLNEALTAAQKGLALSPESAYGHFQLAWVYNELRRYPQLRETVDRMIAIAPEDPDSYLLDALYWAKKAQPERMRQSAEKGLRLDPLNLQCQLLRILALIDLGELNTAEQAAQRVLQQAPEQPHAYTGKGWVYLRRGKYPAAIEQFQQALRLDATSNWAQEGLTTALKSQNPLNRLYFFNPLGRQLFSREQILVTQWLLGGIVLAALLLVVAIVLDNGAIWAGPMGLYVLAYTIVRAVAAEGRDRWRWVGSAVLWGGAITFVAVAIIRNAAAEPLILASMICAMLSYIFSYRWEKLSHPYQIAFGIAGLFLGAGGLSLSWMLLPFSAIALFGFSLSQTLFKLAVVVLFVSEFARFPNNWRES